MRAWSHGVLENRADNSRGVIALEEFGLHLCNQNSRLMIPCTTPRLVVASPLLKWAVTEGVSNDPKEQQQYNLPYIEIAVEES